MKHAKQVCTVEQAKRLSELGILQEGRYSWGARDEFDNIPPTSWRLILGKNWPYRRYSAWTVAELGVMLPSGHDTMHSTQEGWRCYGYDGRDLFDVSYEFVYEAQCRAAAIIHLLENKLITAEEVNQRLLNA